MQVGGDDDTLAAHALGRGRRLAARRGREVEHAVARLGIKGGDDRLTGLVLGRRPPLRDRGQRREVARVPQQQRAGNERSGFDFDARRVQLRGQL